MRKLGEESVVGDFMPDLGEEESGSGARNARLGSVAVSKGQRCRAHDQRVTVADDENRSHESQAQARRDTGRRE